MSHRYNLRPRKTAGDSSSNGSKKAKIEKKEENERTFQNFMEAPSDIRSILINKMKPESRFLFAIASEQCREEAVACNMFLTSIQFEPDSYDVEEQKNAIVSVSHQEQPDTSISSYSYHFDQMRKGVKLVWKTGNSSQLRECAHVNALEAALAKTNELLVQHWHSLRTLRIKNTDAAKFNLDVMLPRLEVLELFWVPKCELVLRKINKPLKELRLFIRKFLEPDVEYFDQIRSTQEKVVIRGIMFTNEQFLQFEAKIINISRGYLNLQNIQEYINNWRKSGRGSEEKKLRFYDNFVLQHERRRDEIDIREELARSYGIDYVRGHNYIIKIQHISLPVYAALTIFHPRVGFEVPYREDPRYMFERYEQAGERNAVRIM